MAAAKGSSASISGTDARLPGKPKDDRDYEDNAEYDSSSSSSSSSSGTSGSGKEHPMKEKPAGATQSGGNNEASSDTGEGSKSEKMKSARVNEGIVQGPGKMSGQESAANEMEGPVKEMLQLQVLEPRKPLGKGLLQPMKMLHLPKKGTASKTDINGNPHMH